MSAPSVSVIIPAYNAARFIEETLHGVYAQTYRADEVIVVDDGSTDDTMKRVHAFGRNVQCISQPRRGPAAARNIGIALSQNRLLAFLDADDVWLPHFLEHQVSALESDPRAGIAYTWWGFIDASSDRLPEVSRPTYAGQVLTDLLMGCFVSFSMSLFRRDCFEQAGLVGRAANHFDDWELLLRVASAGFAFVNVPEVLMLRRIHAHNWAGDTNTRLGDERIVLQQALSAYDPDGAASDGLRARALRRFFVSGAMEYIREGAWDTGMAMLAEGITLEPETLERPGTFLAMAFGLLPYGYATWGEMQRNADTIARQLVEIVRALFAGSILPDDVSRREKIAWSNLMLALVVLFGCSRRWVDAVRSLTGAVFAHPLSPAKAAWKTVLSRPWAIPIREHSKVPAVRPESTGWSPAWRWR